VACDVIETHVLGWLESCTPEAYSYSTYIQVSYFVCEGVECET
jgi:hypothetical protein